MAILVLETFLISSSSFFYWPGLHQAGPTYFLGNKKSELLCISALKFASQF
jgi:hypothetical protein